MISLTRSVTVKSFDLEGTVSIGRSRPEFLAVAKLAEDLGRPIGAQDVLRELLGNLPHALGEQVIERCIRLGLLRRDADGVGAILSDPGRKALEYGQVLVPEEGVWRLYWVDDPLVPQGLIHAQRIETDDARNEIKASKEARDGNVPPLRAEPIPAALKPHLLKIPYLSVQEGSLFQPISVAGNGGLGPRGSIRITLEWDEEITIRIHGALPSAGDDVKSKPFDTAIEPVGEISNLTYAELWDSLVSGATGITREDLAAWREKAGKPLLPSKLETLPEPSRFAFVKDLDIPPLEVRGIGAFDATVIKDVDLVPDCESEAQRWLHWLQWQEVNDYQMPVPIEYRGASLLAMFEYHYPTPMTPEKMAAIAIQGKATNARYILAPYDLGLWS